MTTFEDKERMFSVIRTIIENPRGILTLRMSQDTCSDVFHGDQSYRVCMDGLGSQGDGTWISLLPTSKRVIWVMLGHLLKVLLEN